MATRLDARPRRVAPWIGLGLGVAVLWPLCEIGGGWAVTAGIGIGLAAVAIRRRWPSTVPTALLAWARTLVERGRAHSAGRPPMRTGTIIMKSVVGGVMIAAAFILLALGVQFVSLMGNPF
jgi:hypothetical protein